MDLLGLDVDPKAITQGVKSAHKRKGDKKTLRSAPLPVVKQAPRVRPPRTTKRSDRPASPPFRIGAR